MLIDPDVQSVDLAFWRRVEAPGHDACRLIIDATRWSLDGAAVFLHDGEPAQLAYHLDGDPEWRTRRGTVRGFVGPLQADLTIVRSVTGVWTLNGRVVEGLDDCEHLDYSFTPSTNLPQLRRIALAEHQSAQVPVAWLDPPFVTLARLPQLYARRSSTAYWYEAPTVGYSGKLEVSPAGFVRTYPELWEMVR